MNASTRRMAAGAVLVGITLMAVAWTWRTLMAPPAINLALHRGVGERFADEIAQSVGPNGQLVLVTLERGTSPVLDAQFDAFQKRLGKWPGLEVVRTDEVDASKGDKYGPGTGMSARRWQRLAEKHAEVDAIVSFIGTPDPKDLRLTNGAAGSGGKPGLYAVSRSPKELAPLLEAGVLKRAVVPRFTFPAPGPETPRTPEEWFMNRYQVVTPGAVK
ncbi:MAG: hypothetical protein JNK85_02130 [Verrucomicrobiales bacterium]|nr:hypothetical protein [Verrucomicrobiales bacterium]